MADSYVCSKAKIKCSCGDKISTLTVFPDRTIWLTGEPQANISDHISMRNIAPFGKCHTTVYPATGSATAANHGHLTPMPCVPNTPFPWMNGKNDVLLKGQPALLKSSSCKCVWGGTITFTYDGQVDGTGKDVVKENSQTQEELDANSEVELSAEDILEGLQMALDAAGLFPGLGAMPDLLNACISACRGDWTNAGLCLFAAIPGIGDAAGAAKLMKNGAKMAQKTKKAQKATSGVADIAEARAKKEARTQQERLVEKGIAEGKIVKIESKQNVVLKREATTGNTIEINQLSSGSGTETIHASSGNPYEKVTPITPSQPIGSRTSYGAGNRDWNMASIGQRPTSKEEPLFKMKKQTPVDKVIKLDDVKKPKGTEEVQTKINNGENRPQFGI